MFNKHGQESGCWILEIPCKLKMFRNDEKPKQNKKQNVGHGDNKLPVLREHRRPTPSKNNADDVNCENNEFYMKI